MAVSVSLVRAFAVVLVTDAPRSVDQILGRPVVVRIRAPGREVVVESDGVADGQPLDRRAHVAGNALEGELRTVDADDGEPSLAIGGVPCLQMRERAQAVDARIRPEVDENDSPAQLSERQWRTVRGVEPLRDAAEVGGAGLAPCRHGRRRPYIAELVELCSRRRASLDSVLECCGVAGNCGCEALVDAERDSERGCGNDDARNLSSRRRVRAHDLHSRAESLSSDRDREHRDRSADRVRGRHEDDAEADLTAGGQRGHRREHGPRARNEDEADAEPDHEAVRVLTDSPPRQEQKRALQDPGDALRQQARGEDQQGDDRDRAQEVGREPERAEQSCADERERRERHDEAGDDRIRPSAIGARRASRENDREHRQDAG